MQQNTRLKIRELIANVITDKLKKYSAETHYKPFYEALFEKKVIIQASIFHSFYTSFGIFVYEQIAKLIAIEEAGYKVETQDSLPGCIDEQTEILIVFALVPMFPIRN